MKWKLGVLYSVVLVLLVIGGCLLYDKTKPKFIIEQGQLQLLTEVECGLYEMTSELNVINCDLATVSYIVQQMQDDEFEIEQVVTNKVYMDIFLNRDIDTYRLHYTKDGILISICNNYEKSFVPFTYINEE
ncbi:MAG: hypothetical protein IJE43_18980 [Alphaproteobacteria bacterium]|nr:hypothetical protein [Alphaproteobacteria bacterium]